MISEKQRAQLLTGILVVFGVFMLFGYFRIRSEKEAVSEKYYDLHLRYEEQETRLEKLQGVLNGLQQDLDNCKAKDSQGTI